MKILSILTISSLALYAHAFPKPMPLPQAFDFDAIQALPPPPKITMSVGVTAQTVKINTAAIIKSAVQAVTTDPLDAPARKVKRQAVATSSSSPSSCVGGSPQPTGAFPPSSPDTPDGFKNDPQYATIANAATTPSGYIQVYKALTASTVTWYYLGYTLMSSYDTQACANLCSSKDLCQSFNVLFERDPSVDPGTGIGCSNPPSTVVVK